MCYGCKWYRWALKKKNPTPLSNIPYDAVLYFLIILGGETEVFQCPKYVRNEKTPLF